MNDSQKASTTKMCDVCIENIQKKLPINYKVSKTFIQFRRGQINP